MDEVMDQAAAAEAEGIGRELEGDEALCEKPFSPETARVADVDEPCRDGLG